MVFASFKQAMSKADGYRRSHPGVKIRVRQVTIQGDTWYAVVGV